MKQLTKMLTDKVGSWRPEILYCILILSTRAAEVLITSQSDFSSPKSTTQLASILRKITWACRESLFDIHSEESKKIRSIVDV